ncbi:hypothetical protein F4694_003677 [Bacillus niacini]|uniref:Uncharacterized protein n=1 Tax=Neobacillus niacini TaxID=86668 RepID=A0A852TH18_9BACI|nr:hypothetical protein [Neobacillus niacini]
MTAFLFAKKLDLMVGIGIGRKLKRKYPFHRLIIKSH